MKPNDLKHRALRDAAGKHGILGKAVLGVPWVPRHSSTTIRALERAGLVRSDGAVYRATAAGRGLLDAGELAASRRRPSSLPLFVWTQRLDGSWDLGAPSGAVAATVSSTGANWVVWKEGDAAEAADCGAATSAEAAMCAAERALVEGGWHDARANALRCPRCRAEGKVSYMVATGERRWRCPACGTAIAVPTDEHDREERAERDVLEAWREVLAAGRALVGGGGLEGDLTPENVQRLRRALGTAEGR